MANDHCWIPIHFETPTCTLSTIPLSHNNMFMYFHQIDIALNNPKCIMSRTECKFEIPWILVYVQIAPTDSGTSNGMAGSFWRKIAYLQKCCTCIKLMLWNKCPSQTYYERWLQSSGVNILGSSIFAMNTNRLPHFVMQ